MHSIPPGANGEPLVRARFCQEWLTLIEREEDPYRSRFFALIPKETRALIDGAVPVTWLPMAVHVKLADIQLESFGTVRAHGYYRRAFAINIKGPILGPLVATGVRLLGLSPGSFVRWASRGYDAAYKNAGHLAGEVVGPEHARLVFTNLPPVCTASEAWLMSAQGSAYGIFDVLDVDGIVRLDMRGRAEGRMVLDLEWGADKRPPTEPPPAGHSSAKIPAAGHSSDKIRSSK